MQLLFVLWIFAVLHKRQASKVGVTVAAMDMTCFFNHSLTLIAALRFYSLSGLLSPSSLILASFFILFSLLAEMPKIQVCSS